MVDKAKPETPAPKGKSYKADTGKFDTLKVNQSVSGFFVGAKMQQIKDQRTQQMKDLFVIKIRDEQDANRIYKIPCAAMMKQAWDDIVDDYGNGDEEQAIKRLRSQKIRINRGDDTTTKSGDRMGTYEIIVYSE